MNLELFAMRWLRWERRCPIVLRERSPREWQCGRPDVIGVLPSRYLIEIEIKRTLSDFKADSQKRSRKTREMYQAKHAKQFYYLVPPQLVDRVSPMIPEWAGLMAGPGRDDIQQVRVVKVAPPNKASLKLSVKECCHMVYLVTNHALSTAENLERWMGGPAWPMEPEFEI